MIAPPTARPADEKARLIAVAGPLRGEVLPLTSSTVTLGRDTSNDICLADLALSRAHCTLAFDSKVWRVRDLKSSNGTYVNGIPVGDSALSNGDRPALGESIFLFMSDGALPPVLDSPASPIAYTTRIRIADTDYLRVEQQPAASRIERDLRALLRIATALNTVATEDELQRELLDLVATTIPADQIAIVTLDPDGEIHIGLGTQRSSPAPIA